MKRLFSIIKENNCIDLSQSCLMINNKPAPIPFSSEVFKVTFTLSNNSNKRYDLFLSYDELIEEEEIQNLKNSLNIEIIGDGACFEIVHFTEDFSLQFDLENSQFNDCEYIKNGLLHFKKN